MRDFRKLLTDGKLNVAGEAMAHIVEEYGLALYTEAAQKILAQDAILSEWDRIITAHIDRDGARFSQDFQVWEHRKWREAQHTFARMHAGDER